MGSVLDRIEHLMTMTPEEAHRQMMIASDCVGENCPPKKTPVASRVLLPTSEEDWRRVDILLTRVPERCWSLAQNKADDDQVPLSVWVTNLVNKELGL